MRVDELRKGNEKSIDFEIEAMSKSGDIKSCYEWYYHNNEDANLTKKSTTKENKKEFLKSVMPERLYVILCIQSEKNMLEFWKTCLERSVNKYTNGKSRYPMLLATTTKMLQTIERLYNTEHHDYELLSKIDKISIEYINEFYLEYRKRKFDEIHSYGYKTLIVEYNCKWNKSKNIIYELVHDCNFYDSLQELWDICEDVENSLGNLLHKERNIMLEKYDAAVNKIINANKDYEDELRLIYNNGIDFLNSNVFREILCIARYSDTYIDKEIIEKKLEDAIKYFLNSFEKIKESRKKDRDKIQLLSFIDKKLDTVPKILDYFPELRKELEYSIHRKKMVNSIFNQKAIKQLFLEAYPESAYNYDAIEHYIKNPDFEPQYLIDPAPEDRGSILNCMLIANYIERYVKIDFETLKKLYNTPYLSASTKSKLRGRLFLEKRYNKSSYFLAFRTESILFANPDLYKIRKPEIVEINRKTYQTIFDKYASFFRETELNEPGADLIEDSFFQIAMSLASDLKKNGERIDIDSMSLQDIINLRNELNKKQFSKKTEWVRNPLQFAMAMNQKQWASYNNRMEEIIGSRINLLPDLYYPNIENYYVYDEFWKSVRIDSIMTGIYCFDNRKMDINGEPIFLTKQRIQNPIQKPEEDLSFQKKYTC